MLKSVYLMCYDRQNKNKKIFKLKSYESAGKLHVPNTKL